jgi:hypothetical protein
MKEECSVVLLAQRIPDYLGAEYQAFVYKIGLFATFCC